MKESKKDSKETFSKSLFYLQLIALILAILAFLLIF